MKHMKLGARDLILLQLGGGNSRAEASASDREKKNMLACDEKTRGKQSHRGCSFYAGLSALT